MKLLPFSAAVSGASCANTTRKTSPAGAESGPEHRTGDRRPTGACRGERDPLPSWENCH